MVITIDLSALDNLENRADGIFLSSDGEHTLYQICLLEQKIEEARKLAEQKLEEKAIAINPNFKSIQGNDIKVSYRQYGSKYYIDETQIAKTPTELYKIETKYKVDTKAVEKYIDTNKGIPVGIIEIDRPKKLSFGLKKGGAENDNA